ncbi:MAG: hemolysin family protein [Candidatus Eremiobacterota bacterium]
MEAHLSVDILVLSLPGEMELSYLTTEVAASIIIVFILIILGGCLSAANLALSSLSKVKVRELTERNIKGSYILHRLIEKRSYSLITLVIANLLVILIADNLTHDTIEYYAKMESYKVSIITTIIVSVMILFSGEVIFRTISTYNIEKFSLSIARPVEIMYYIFYPVSWLLINSSNFTGKLLGINVEHPYKQFITQDHIRLLVEEGEEQGVFEEQEKEMIHSIISFGDTIAREIMIPRISMICIEVNQTIDNVLNAILETGYSRIPVYEETIDNIVGIVYEKDMLKILKDNRLNINIRDIMRAAYFTPEIKKIDELLKEMQKDRISMAIVVDEYGGTDGLITVEDILEEIVGEIEDEYDQKTSLLEDLGNNTFIVNARMNIEDVNSYFDINLPVDECETIGGFVYGLLGRIPAQGEEVKLDSISIIVEKIHRRMIKKLKIKKNTENLANKEDLSK